MTLHLPLTSLRPASTLVRLHHRSLFVLSSEPSHQNQFALKMIIFFSFLFFFLANQNSDLDEIKEYRKNGKPKIVFRAPQRRRVRDLARQKRVN